MADRSSHRWSIDLPSHDAMEGLSKDERLAIIRGLNAQLNRHPAIIALSVVSASVASVAGATLHWPIAAWLQTLGVWRVPSHVIGAILTAAGAAVVTLVAGYWLLWNIHRRAFRRALREVGRDVCVGCGYWLRGLDETVKRCPECGTEREAMPGDA